MKKLYTPASIHVNGKYYLIFLSFLCSTLLPAQPTMKHDGHEHHPVDLKFHLTRDLNPGMAGAYPGSSYKEGMIAVENKVYFLAFGTGIPEGVYKSDGTEHGTVLVHEFTGGANSFIYKNKHVYFIGRKVADAATYTTQEAIYSTDVETNELKQLTPSYSGYSTYINSYVITDNGGVFYDLVGALHHTNGVPASDQLLASGLEFEGYLVANHDVVFFVANDNVHGYELWKTDGTPAGTSMVKDINPGSASSYPVSLIVFKNKLFFSATNNAQRTFTFWQTNGTASGTVQVRDDVRPLGYDYAENRDKKVYCISKNTLYFTGLTTIGNHAALWKSKGTRKTTKLVKDINPGGNSILRDLTDVNGTVFFTGDDGIHGKELWKTDGKEANTVLVKDIIPDGTLEQDPSEEYDYSYYFLTNVNGTLYFRTLINGVSQMQSSRGKASNTRPVDDAIVKELTGFSYLVAADEKLFFSGESPVYGQELFVGEPVKHHDKDYDKQAEKLSYDKVITRLDATISPNPATSNAILHLTGSSANTIITMVDVTGKRIWQTRSRNDQGIRLPASIQKGVYFVVISSGQELRTVKFIKE